MVAGRKAEPGAGDIGDVMAAVADVDEANDVGLNSSANGLSLDLLAVTATVAWLASACSLDVDVAAALLFASDSLVVVVVVGGFDEGAGVVAFGGAVVDSFVALTALSTATTAAAGGCLTAVC